MSIRKTRGYHDRRIYRILERLTDQILGPLHCGLASSYLLFSSLDGETYRFLCQHLAADHLLAVCHIRGCSKETHGRVLLIPLGCAKVRIFF